MASASMTGPALVNIGSSFQVGYANGATGKAANGYIANSVTSGNPATVYFSGLVTGQSGLTPGPVFLSPSSPGGVTQTPPASGSGDYVQQVGMAVSATAYLFQPDPI